MFRLIFVLVLFCMSLKATTNSLKEEVQETAFDRLSNRVNCHGDETLKYEITSRIVGLPKSLTSQTLFSGQIPDSQKEIIGQDRRQFIHDSMPPSTCIASLEVRFDNITSYGTGFLIAPYYVMTSAHNIYIHDSKPTSIMCYFGRSRNSIISFCEVDAITYQISSENGQQIPYCLLLLETPMGHKVGFVNPMRFNPDFWINIIGYPAYYYGKEEEQVIGTRQYQSYSKDVLVKGDDVYHNIQTTLGQSGAPILMSFFNNNDFCSYFIGMHLYGAEKVNSSTQLSPEEALKYPYRGIAMTEKLAENLEYLIEEMNSWQRNEHQIREQLDLKDNIYLYPLKTYRSERKKLYDSSSFSNSSSDLSEESLEEKLTDTDLSSDDESSLENSFCSIL